MYIESDSKVPFYIVYFALFTDLKKSFPSERAKQNKEKIKL